MEIVVFTRPDGVWIYLLGLFLLWNTKSIISIS